MAISAEQLQQPKLKILIAEDDFAIALALKTILKNNLNCELTVTNNGEEAWEKIQSNPFDLILSDWNMPYKTGCELLADVRGNENTKAIPFFMLTARADKNSVIDAVKGGVDGYIHKPFDRADLLKKLTEALQKNEAAEKPSKKQIVDQIITKLKNNDFALPALSDVAEKLTRMAENNTASADEIADLFKNDPVIAARLVALSNTASYRGVRNCSSLEDAITRIGIKDTINYIWFFCNKGLFESKNKNFAEILLKLRDHCLATAECARLIAKHLKQKNTNDYFYMGLMHDIGVVLVLEILKEISNHNPITDVEEIDKVLQALHHQFGTALLKRWNMSETLQTIAQCHDDLSLAPEVTTELLVVHFANLYTKQIGYNNGFNNVQPIDIASTESAQKLQLDSEFISSLETDVNAYMKEIHKMM
ncbi:MAG: HDOD domain-containing protein [Gammaproteobacteria bacterium]|jgi:HD-like signal output (HDOD) protein/CheY-like chemotaxis protein|nr:HDOD domain-containing protein [Gammaproteobacteria bacterium]